MSTAASVTTASMQLQKLASCYGNACVSDVDSLPKTDKKSDITQSAVYKMIHDIDQPRPRPRAPPTPTEGQPSFVDVNWHFVPIHCIRQSAGRLPLHATESSLRTKTY